ncbi:iron-containing redox enzyme family protein [Amycolatopsis sp. QT-25]|uniref:iron-containing redox enzyme family protein n=1 Tax=Amycolatopsis sp. QT-25 TaxID=3034022 RepID=UPI0023EAD006|nr:iron-containing redox enzyme family protein [Amycolatopsis sp. QT-25]WET76279.1 iron-containing redox enzyme family protein [Amycolatopsis sp. QT-25]
MAVEPTLVPDDTTTALPPRPFHFTPGTDEAVDEVIAAGPREVFRTLLQDRESETTLLLARRVLHAFLAPARVRAVDDLPAAVGELVEQARAELVPAHASLAAADREVRADLLRQRGVIALLDGCWLDAVSQPATQPALVVNRLFGHHVVLAGGGNPLESAQHRRTRALEDAGAALPDVAAADFLDRAEARPATILLACFPLALAVLPANFLPEVVGVHHAFHRLGIDDRLLGTPPPIPPGDLDALLAEYAGQASPQDRGRVLAAVELTLSLEREHLGLLIELLEFRRTQTLESKVAEVISRHAPLAGKQHGRVTLGDRTLVETFAGFGRIAAGADPVALAEFLAEFRESPYLVEQPDGDCRFLAATRFGGSMFGIFDEREAKVLADWIATVHKGAKPSITVRPNTVGDALAARWSAAIRDARPDDVVFDASPPSDDRELFYRLVNIENHAATLQVAADRAERCFADAQVLFEHGAGGRYTDASFFEYDADALYARAEKIYWEKLVEPYEPLKEVPDADEVLFEQSTYQLTYLIDGAWLHRVGRLGRRERESDGMLFRIHADEMGNGDVRKNHLTLTRRAMVSQGRDLPHIRTEEFTDQDELPDDMYGFALQQLSMCLLPDRFYNEILGYNLAIEMFGSGEMRLHEIQKLRHHGFDDCYEQAHLTIDNFSAGHAKQAADIIVAYLDRVRRNSGEAAVAGEWRRVWRGYASFAFFLEQPLLREVATAEPTDESTELVL